MDQTFFLRGPNFFFHGPFFLFMTASKTNTRRAHPRGPKPKSRVSHFRKSAKLFFSMDQTFFFGGQTFFPWGCFFLFLEGFFTFLSKLPDPNPKNNKRNCTGTAPPYRRAQRTNADRPRKTRFPVATCLFFVESVYHRPGALPPDPRRGDTPRTPRGLRKVLLQKSATPVIFGLLARLDYAGSTQLDELRRSS